MKINHFLSLAAIFAIVFTFFACSGDSPTEPQGGEPSSDTTKLCGGVEYDVNDYRCEYGELITKCNGADYRPAYQVCNNGRVEDKNPMSSNPDISSSSVPGSSSSSVYVPTDETFLGIGYDVINSAYINRDEVAKYRNYPILDRENMFQDGIISNSPASIEEFQTVAGSSVKEVIVERGKKIGVSVDGGVLFSGGISSDFENLTNENKKESIFLAKLNYYRYTDDHKINAATPQNLSKYLTESFKSALSGGKSASEIFNLYGTHVFIQYYKGGTLEANYTYTGSELSSKESVRIAAGGSFSAIAGPKVKGDVSELTNTAEFEKTENLAFKYKSIGGDAIGAPSISDLRDKFSKWAETIENKTEICGIAAFNSLMPIWDLARAGGYSSKATELESVYKELVSKKGLALPLARKYKTEYYNSSINTITNGPNSLKPPTGGTIAELEIYALGAGGGGQGGNNNSNFVTYNGTGGAGGGGAAVYLKLGKLGLNPGEQVPLSITVGTGGLGGDIMQLTSFNYTNTAGCSGKDGSPTTVKWETKNITLTAKGGSGGGGNSTCKEGGGTGVKGGAISIGSCPAKSEYQLDCKPADGDKGTDGNIDADLKSTGGKAAKIDSLNFGGDSGGVREKNSDKTQPRASDGFGGGGRGGFVYGGYVYNGEAGGKGLVNIIVYSYTEE